MRNKNIPIISSISPTSNNRVSSGYPIDVKWFNTTNKKSYEHISDGVWNIIYKTPKYLAESGKLLGFDSNLDPKMVFLLSENDEPTQNEIVIGTEWYCDATDRVYTWVNAWVDLHNTFPFHSISVDIIYQYDQYEYESSDYE